MFDVIAAAVIALSPAQSPAAPVDTTVCHQVDGQWLSDYSQSGLCTFGSRLDDVTPALDEDGPAFDCRTMGNQVCGVGNAQGVEPGFYGWR